LISAVLVHLLYAPTPSQRVRVNAPAVKSGWSCPMLHLLQIIWSTFKCKKATRRGFWNMG